MTSKQKAYQQQSRKSVQTKHNSHSETLRDRTSKTRPVSDRNDIQFAKFSPQATINNVARSSVVQPKLQIGEVGDKYEQEADRVAKATVEQINTPETQQVQRDILPQPEEELQMKPLAEKRVLQAKPIPTISTLNTPQVSLQAKGIGGGAASPDLEDNINSAKSGGQSLALDLQAKMGRAMGANFSNVKVHTDSQSDSLNQSLQAKAFTTGQHIFFKKSEYNPTSKGGQELIAHELTHVVQQNRPSVQCKQLDTVVQRMGFVEASQQINQETSRQMNDDDYIDRCVEHVASQIRLGNIEELASGKGYQAYKKFCEKEYVPENSVFMTELVADTMSLGEIFDNFVDGKYEINVSGIQALSKKGRKKFGLSQFTDIREKFLVYAVREVNNDLYKYPKLAIELARALGMGQGRYRR